MASQLSGIAASELLLVEDFFIEENDSVFRSQRFFKVTRTKIQEEEVLVKVFLINERDSSLPQKYLDWIEKLKTKIDVSINCLPFQKCILNDKVGILIRDFVKFSLYERISTRPFLLSIEKKWIAFQILNALAQCHKLGICHGDIKLENICVTSWNWVLLTDFALFKPTYLTEDNPEDFSYFFTTSKRRTCYIAPERFVKTLRSNSNTHLVLPENNLNNEELKPSMDIFSAGCTLAELFSEGQPPFDLPQLLSYRNGEYSLEMYLNKFEDGYIRNLIASMVSKDPSKRLSANQYLQESKGKQFPYYFYDFMVLFNKMSHGIPDDEFSDVLSSKEMPILSCDEKFDRMCLELHNAVAVILGEHIKSQSNECETCDDLVLVISMITSCIRGFQFVASKLEALQILVELAAYLTPETILDRILPYVMYLMEGHCPRVRISAIQSLVTILSDLHSVPPWYTHIFPECILPCLAEVVLDEVVSVRVALAEQVGAIAEISRRVLDYRHMEHNEVQSNSYKNELNALHEMVMEIVKILLMDSNNIVKQYIIEHSFVKLSIFFGDDKSNDLFLVRMIPFLNSVDDKQIRGTFFDCIVDVGYFLGIEYCFKIHKFLLVALTDSEEIVTYKAVCAVEALIKMGLLQTSAFMPFLSSLAPLLVHPSRWLRQAVVSVINVMGNAPGCRDIHHQMVSEISPLLKSDAVIFHLKFFTSKELKPYVPRSLFDKIKKSSDLPFLLGILNERRSARKGTLGINDIRFNNHRTQSFETFFNQLLREGLTKDIEDNICFMKKYLSKMNVTSPPDTEESSNRIINICVEESHHLLENPIQVHDIKKLIDRGDSFVVINDECKTVFGTKKCTTLEGKHPKDPNNWIGRKLCMIEHSIRERSYLPYRFFGPRLEVIINIFEQLENSLGDNKPPILLWSVSHILPNSFRLQSGLYFYYKTCSDKRIKYVIIPGYS